MDEDKNKAPTGEPTKGQEQLEALLKRAREGDPEARRKIARAAESVVDLIKTFWETIVRLGNEVIAVLGPVLQEIEKARIDVEKIKPDPDPPVQSGGVPDFKAMAAGERPEPELTARDLFGAPIDLTRDGAFDAGALIAVRDEHINRMTAAAFVEAIEPHVTRDEEGKEILGGRWPSSSSLMADLVRRVKLRVLEIQRGKGPRQSYEVMVDCIEFAVVRNDTGGYTLELLEERKE